MPKPFIIYGNCAVTYNGRARSVLEPGNFLIVYKSDGSLSIHGDRHIKPINYQSNTAIIEFISEPERLTKYESTWDNKPILVIHSKRKKEIISILFFSIISYQVLEDWTDGKLKLIGSENELREYIVNNFYDIVGFQPLSLTIEYPTPYGPLDIHAREGENILCIIEVKRGTAGIAACSQLERYAKFFSEEEIHINQILASPRISKNALKYCKDHGQTWLQVALPGFNSQL